MRKERFGGGGGSRTRVRERPLYDDYVRICFVFLSRELKNQQDAHDPARLFSAFRSEQKPGPIPPYDAIRSPCEPKDRGGYLKIKQRKQTACCWQLLFSDRFTGAQNPARLHTMTRTRRLRSSSRSFRLTGVDDGHPTKAYLQLHDVSYSRSLPIYHRENYPMFSSPLHAKC